MVHFAKHWICTESVSFNEISCVVGKCFEQTLWTWHTFPSPGLPSVVHQWKPRTRNHRTSDRCARLAEMSSPKAADNEGWGCRQSIHHQTVHHENCRLLQWISFGWMKVCLYLATTPPNGWTGLEPHFLTPTFCNNLSTGTQLRKPNHNSALLRSLNHRMRYDSLVVLGSPALQGLPGRITEATLPKKWWEVWPAIPSRSASPYCRGLWQHYRWTDGPIKYGEATVWNPSPKKTWYMNAIARPGVLGPGAQKLRMCVFVAFYSPYSPSGQDLQIWEPENSHIRSRFSPFSASFLPSKTARK